MATGGVAAAARRADELIVEQLREAGATSRERATQLHVLRSLEERRVSRLVTAGVLLEGEPGSYWLDEHAWRKRESRRQAIMFGAGIVVLGLLIILAIVLGLVLQPEN